MEKILVPTDFSQCSDRAEELAVDLARKYAADIHFFHSVQAPVDWVKLSIEEENHYPETQSKIKDARIRFSELENKYEDLIIKTFIGFNLADEDIIQHCNDNKIDFIVMGSHGSSGVREFIIGSNAKKVLELSDIPVLISK